MINTMFSDVLFPDSGSITEDSGPSLENQQQRDQAAATLWFAPKVRRFYALYSHVQRTGRCKRGTCMRYFLTVFNQEKERERRRPVSHRMMSHTDWNYSTAYQELTQPDPASHTTGCCSGWTPYLTVNMQLWRTVTRFHQGQTNCQPVTRDDDACVSWYIILHVVYP